MTCFVGQPWTGIDQKAASCLGTESGAKAPSILYKAPSTLRTEWPDDSTALQGAVGHEAAWSLQPWPIAGSINCPGEGREAGHQVLKVHREVNTNHPLLSLKPFGGAQRPWEESPNL